MAAIDLGDSCSIWVIMVIHDLYFARHRLRQSYSFSFYHPFILFKPTLRNVIFKNTVWKRKVCIIKWSYRKFHWAVFTRNMKKQNF